MSDKMTYAEWDELYASNPTPSLEMRVKAAIAQGATRNQVREMYGFGPLEGGDVPLISMPPRRLKLLVVDPRLVVDLLNWGTEIVNGRECDQFFCLPVTEEIPEGTQLLEVFSDTWGSGNLLLKVEHPSFPITIPGSEIKRHQMFLDVQMFRRCSKDQKIERVPT